MVEYLPENNTNMDQYTDTHGDESLLKTDRPGSHCMPHTVILHALSSHKRAAARRSILCRAASLPHSAMHYDTRLQ